PCRGASLLRVLVQVGVAAGARASRPLFRSAVRQIATLSRVATRRVGAGRCSNHAMPTAARLVRNPGDRTESRARSGRTVGTTGTNTAACAEGRVAGGTMQPGGRDGRRRGVHPG